MLAIIVVIKSLTREYHISRITEIETYLSVCISLRHDRGFADAAVIDGYEQLRVGAVSSYNVGLVLILFIVEAELGFIGYKRVL